MESENSSEAIVTTNNHEKPKIKDDNSVHFIVNNQLQYIGISGGPRILTASRKFSKCRKRKNL